MIPFGPTPRVAIQTLSCKKKKIPFVLQILSILGLLLGYPMGCLYTWQRVTMGKSSVMFLPPSKLVVAVSVSKNMVARGFSLRKFGSRNVCASHIIKCGKVLKTTLVDPILKTRQMSGHLLASLKTTCKKTADQEDSTVCS